MQRFLQCSNVVQCNSRKTWVDQRIIFHWSWWNKGVLQVNLFKKPIGSKIEQKGPHALNFQPSSNSSASSPYTAYADESFKVTISHLSVVILVQGRGRVTASHSAPLPQPHIHPVDRFRAGNRPAHLLKITLCPFHKKSAPFLPNHYWSPISENTHTLLMETMATSCLKPKEITRVSVVWKG